ncbi:hypothetical protein UPYG_G00248670 [Umbra pygmaea]|uniref:C2H2-type domain-containing protein n=1 Tax=Umbra pygmaea TaxID=75934 RepID=A0ABD0W748_UMBPY
MRGVRTICDVLPDRNYGLEAISHRFTKQYKSFQPRRPEDLSATNLPFSRRSWNIKPEVEDGKVAEFMAPVGLVGLTDVSIWASSSPEVCFLSLLLFLILTITVLTVCIKCHRKQANQMDATYGGQTIDKKDTSTTQNSFSYDDNNQDATLPSWRHHKNMPESKLPETHVATPHHAATQPPFHWQAARAGGSNEIAKRDLTIDRVNCTITMATLGPGDSSQCTLSPSAPQNCPSVDIRPPRERGQDRLAHTLCFGQEGPSGTEKNTYRNIPERNRQGLIFAPQGRTEAGWNHLSAPQQTTSPTMHSCPSSATCRVRSPGSVDMDEIMAAMVLTSLSCTSVVHDPPHSHTDPVPGGDMESGGGYMKSGGGDMESGGGDMECGGGELSDSGSSGYWSWDHGNISPAPSPSVAETDSSPDEGLLMELEHGEELNHTKKLKGGFKGVYKCLWPSCGKLLPSSVGMRRHIRVLHLGTEHSDREEDFYYTKIFCEAPTGPSPVSPVPPVPASVLGLPASVLWASCGSHSGPDRDPGLQIPSTSSGSSGPGSAPGQPSALSQSAPSSFWQIQTEHLYPACTPVQVTVTSRSPAPCHWTPPPLTVTSTHPKPQIVTGRCRSVSVGEQWLQQNSATNRLTTMNAASPSRTHCSFRKTRSEAKKCRKVYGLDHKDQWCTACRWKKACQRFPD